MKCTNCKKEFKENDLIKECSTCYLKGWKKQGIDIKSKDQDMEYLDEHFPKGDKRRGEVMVLLALARIEGRTTNK